MKVKVRERRQITLPREMLDALGVGIGDTLEVIQEEGALIVRPGRRAALDALEEIRRALAESGVTEDELQESGREIRKEMFRESYPELARKYGV